MMTGYHSAEMYARFLHLNRHRFTVPPSDRVSAGWESGEPLAGTHCGSIWPCLVLDSIRQLALRGCVHPVPAEHHRQTPSCASAASLIRNAIWISCFFFFSILN